MEIVLKLAEILVLTSIVYQDFTSRKISLILVLILTGLVATDSTNSVGYDFISYSIINLLLMALQLIVIFIFFSLWKKILISQVADKYIGWGDIVMIGILALGFSTGNFILFYSFCLIISLVVVLISKLKTSSNNYFKTIPLAGMIAFFWNVLIVISIFKPTVNTYNDSWIIRQMENLI